MELMEVGIALPENSAEICILCGSRICDPIHLGDQYKLNGIVVHYYCVLLSFGLPQIGDDNIGIHGFLYNDIKKAVERGASIDCVYCGKKGASIQCATCRIKFHLPCSRLKGSLTIFDKQFDTFCEEHRPSQKIPLDAKTESLMNNIDCVICYDTISVGIHDTFMAFWLPCCKKNWCHRSCLAKLALSQASLFKCPICQNNRKFKMAAVKFGIFIPVRDASWELVPGGYYSARVYAVCDALFCHCARGRSFDNVGTRYELLICSSCGFKACHIQCAKLKFYAHQWECSDCYKVTSTLNPDRNKEHHSYAMPESLRLFLDKDSSEERDNPKDESNTRDSDNNPDNSSDPIAGPSGLGRNSELSTVRMTTEGSDSSSSSSSSSGDDDSDKTHLENPRRIVAIKSTSGRRFKKVDATLDSSGSKQVHPYENSGPGVQKRTARKSGKRHFKRAQKVKSESDSDVDVITIEDNAPDIILLHEEEEVEITMVYEKNPMKLEASSKSTESSSKIAESSSESTETSSKSTETFSQSAVTSPNSAVTSSKSTEKLAAENIPSIKEGEIHSKDNKLENNGGKMVLQFLGDLLRNVDPSSVVFDDQYITITIPLEENNISDIGDIVQLWSNVSVAGNETNRSVNEPIAGYSQSNVGPVMGSVNTAQNVVTDKSFNKLIAEHSQSKVRSVTGQTINDVQVQTNKLLNALMSGPNAGHSQSYVRIMTGQIVNAVQNVAENQTNKSLNYCNEPISGPSQSNVNFITRPTTNNVQLCPTTGQTVNQNVPDSQQNRPKIGPMMGQTISTAQINTDNQPSGLFNQTNLVGSSLSYVNSITMPICQYDETYRSLNMPIAGPTSQQTVTTEQYAGNQINRSYNEPMALSYYGPTGNSVQYVLQSHTNRSFNEAMAAVVNPRSGQTIPSIQKVAGNQPSGTSNNSISGPIQSNVGSIMGPVNTGQYDETDRSLNMPIAEPISQQTVTTEQYARNQINRSYNEPVARSSTGQTVNTVTAGNHQKSRSLKMPNSRKQRPTKTVQSVIKEMESRSLNKGISGRNHSLDGLLSQSRLVKPIPVYGNSVQHADGYEINRSYNEPMARSSPVQAGITIFAGSSQSNVGSITVETAQHFETDRSLNKQIAEHSPSNVGSVTGQPINLSPRRMKFKYDGTPIISLNSRINVNEVIVPPSSDIPTSLVTVNPTHTERQLNIPQANSEAACQPRTSSPKNRNSSSYNVVPSEPLLPEILTTPPLLFEANYVFLPKMCAVTGQVRQTNQSSNETELKDLKKADSSLSTKTKKRKETKTKKRKETKTKKLTKPDESKRKCTDKDIYILDDDDNDDDDDFIESC